MKSIFLFVFNLSILLCSGQLARANTIGIATDSTDIPKEQLFELVKFRDYLLREKEDDLYRLRDILAEWKAKGLNEYDQEFLSLNVGLKKKYHNKTGDGFLKRVNKLLAENNVNIILTHDDLDVIGEMFEVLQLIKLGILDHTYPFIINRDTDFFKELNFFQIEEGEVVFEIGAGSGMFGLMMKLIYPDISLYINELSYLNFNLIQELIEKHSLNISTRDLYCIKGSKKSTELESHIANKIIIRHTLHHFKKMEEMLHSIKQSMNADSYLFIRESTSDLHGYEGDCDYKMSKNEILELMDRHGFKLENMLDVGDSILLSYRLKG